MTRKDHRRIADILTAAEPLDDEGKTTAAAEILNLAGLTRNLERLRVRLKKGRAVPMALAAFVDRVGTIVEEIEAFEGNPIYRRVMVQWGDRMYVVAASHLEEAIEIPRILRETA